MLNRTLDNVNVGELSIADLDAGGASCNMQESCLNCRIVIDYPNIIYENREGPNEHLFQTDTKERNAAIFIKGKAMSSRTATVKEKKRGISAVSVIWPWVAIIGVIVAAAAIRSQLLSVPFERDEGEYAYIAQQMLKGVPPYVSAYSMKLPGIYVVYAMIMAVFGQTHTAVHLGLLIFNAATIFVIFLLAKNFSGRLPVLWRGGLSQ